MERLRAKYKQLEVECYSRGWRLSATPRLRADGLSANILSGHSKSWKKVNKKTIKYIIDTAEKESRWLGIIEG